MKKTIAAAMALMLWSAGAGAERLADILHTIGANNTGLKAMLKDIEADNADARADNTVGGPSVEYSPFWQKNVDGIASSELVVSQEFDFPTLYSARGKSADLKDKALMLRYDAARRDLLLQAKGLCIDLVKLRKERELLDLRRGYADTMLRLIEKKERAGASTALEVNKTRMEKMSLDAAVQSNDAGQMALVEQLTALNASLPLDLNDLDYPSTDRIADYQTFKEMALSSDPAILAARGDVAAARQDLNVSRREWLLRSPWATGATQRPANRPTALSSGCHFRYGQPVSAPAPPVPARPQPSCAPTMSRAGLRALSKPSTAS